MFSVRIVNVDHYLSTPLQGLDITYSQFRGSQVKQVPIIRIFGSTPGGKKTCLHIHGVFPYLLVPYDGSDDVQRLMYVIAASLDKAINISLGISNSTKQHVFKILQVSGSPFYGYHDVEHQFLKIFFYNPSMVKRASDLLQSGAICNKVLQPHESHVPFILQFFIDYNLYGMSFIQLKHFICRRNADEQPGINENGFEIPLRMSRTELEVDALATDIHNKLEISEDIAINPGLAAIWEDEKQRKKDESSFFDPVESQPRLNIQPTLSEVLMKDKLKNTLAFQLVSPSLKITPQSLIPYPAVTQEGCDILNASTLNTHCMMSNTAMPDNMFDDSNINEEVILSLTSELDETCFLSSQDQSLLNVLENLAEDVELGVDKQTSCNIQYIVEADSILGSQLLTNEEEEEDLIEACQQIDNLELQYDTRLTAEEQTEEIQHWDDNILKMSSSSIPESIPQVDGTDDVFDRTKSEKEKRVREDDDSCSVIEVTEVESHSLWPIVGSEKEVDCCDEVFSDSNESINFVEKNICDVYEISDVIKVEIKDNFEHILRGDPSFMSQTVTSSEDTSFYTSKESLTCTWNNLLPQQQSENSDSNDFLLAKLNDVSKIEDSKKHEFTDAVECDLSDINEKNLQFNETLVPLLNLPDCEEIVYNNYVGEDQSIFPDEILDKCQLVDIFRENVTSPYLEPQFQNMEELKRNSTENTAFQQTNSNRRSEMQNETEESSAPLKEKAKHVQHMKLKIKFKFPVKGETNKLNKKLGFLNNHTSFDITEEYVTAYFKKLEKLKEFYLSRRKMFSCKQNVNYSKHQAKDKLSQKNKQKVVQKDIKDILFKKYKLKECSVLVKRLQLTSDVVKTSRKTKKTNSPKMIINQFEVLQSRPFSTEILKPNSLPNPSSKTFKNKNLILEKDVDVKKTNTREHALKDQINCITKCTSKKKLPNHKPEDSVHKIKHIKCKKKDKFDKQRKKCKESSNLKDGHGSLLDSYKLNFAQNSLKKTDFNEFSCKVIANQLQKISKLKETAIDVMNNNEYKGKHNHKIGLKPCNQNDIGVLEHNKKRTRSNCVKEIKTEFVSAINKCNEKKEKIDCDLNSFKGNCLKTSHQSGENIKIRKYLVTDIEKLNQSESLEREDDSPNKNCSELRELEIKIPYSGVKKANKNKSRKNNKCWISDYNVTEKKMRSNRINGSENLDIRKQTKNNKMDKSLHLEKEKQKKNVLDNSKNNSQNRELKSKCRNYDSYEIEKKMLNCRSSSEHLKICNQTHDNRKHKTLHSEREKKKVEVNNRNSSQNRELQTKNIKSDYYEIEKKMCRNRRSSLELLEICNQSQNNKKDKTSNSEREKKKVEDYNRNCSKNRKKSQENEMKIPVNRINNHVKGMGKNAFGKRVKNIELIEISQKSLDSQKNYLHQKIEKKIEMCVDNESNFEHLKQESKTNSSQIKNVKRKSYSKKNDCSQPIRIEKMTEDNNWEQVEDKLVKTQEYIESNMKTRGRMRSNVGFVAINQKIQDNKRPNSKILDNIQNKSRKKKCLENNSVIHPIEINKTKSNCGKKLSNKSQDRKDKSDLKRNMIKMDTIKFLDGTVDCSSSSSDESTESIKLNVDSNVKIQTPQKKNVPSINPETPTRRYERLNIQIKKSPKSEKSGGTSAEDFKINSAVVQLVRNSELEQMLSTKEPDLQSLTSSPNRNRRQVKDSVEGLKFVSRLKDNVTNEAKPNFFFSKISKRKKLSPLSLLTNEKNNLKVANPSLSDTETSCSAENNKTLLPTCFSKESNSSSDLNCNLGIELDCKADQSQQDVVDTTSTEGMTKMLKNSVKVKNKPSLPSTQTRNEEEPSSSLKDCDKKIPAENRFQAELRVCLRRLSSNSTDDSGELVSKQKRPLDSDFV